MVSTLEMPPDVKAVVEEARAELTKLMDAAEGVLMAASLEGRTDFSPFENSLFRKLGWDEARIHDEFRRLGRVARALQSCSGPSELARRQETLRERATIIKAKIDEIDRVVANADGDKKRLIAELGELSSRVDQGVAARKTCLESPPPGVQFEYNERLKDMRGRHRRCLSLEGEIHWRRELPRLGHGCSFDKILNMRETHLSARRINGDDVPTAVPSNDSRVPTFVSDAAWQSYVQRRQVEADAMEREYQALKPSLDRELAEAEELLKVYWVDPPGSPQAAALQAAPVKETNQPSSKGSRETSATTPPGGIAAPSRRSPLSKAK